jgi:hypothetical protein
MKTFIRLTIVIFLVGAANAFAAEYKPFTVELRPPSGSDTELEVVTGPQGWDKTGKFPGYVGFDAGDLGTITFDLKGEGGGPAAKNQCQDSPPSAKWVITQIKLSDNGHDKEVGGVVIGLEGLNFDGPQDAWLVHAFPGVDPLTGVLYDVSKSEGWTSVAIFNMNDHPAAWGEKIAYYEVTASECDSSSTKTATTDPGVGNRGTN